VSRHDISNTQRAAYLKANQCILKSPPKAGRLPWAKTRWDEFAGLHQIMALQIHSTGNFLPYHRYFLHILKALLAECGYNDTLPYVLSTAVRDPSASTGLTSIQLLGRDA
jgi:tyrosinase